jgi:hypothetical protein
MAPENHDPARSGIPYRKKPAIKSHFLAESITSAARRLRCQRGFQNSSRTTKAYVVRGTILVEVGAPENNNLLTQQRSLLCSVNRGNGDLLPDHFTAMRRHDLF